MKTPAQIREWLDEALADAKREAADSHRTVPNSYGAGHDAGEVYALLRLRGFLNGEED